MSRLSKPISVYTRSEEHDSPASPGSVSKPAFGTRTRRPLSAAAFPQPPAAAAAAVESPMDVEPALGGMPLGFGFHISDSEEEVDAAALMKKDADVFTPRGFHLNGFSLHEPSPPRATGLLSPAEVRRSPRAVASSAQGGLSPVGGVGGFRFSPVKAAAETLAQRGGGAAAKAVTGKTYAGQKRRRWSRDHEQGLAALLKQHKESGELLRASKLAEDFDRIPKHILDKIRRVPEMAQTFEAVNYVNDLVIPGVPATKLKLRPGTAADELSRCMTSGFTVGNNPLVYAALFRCPCGGDLRVLKTAEELKAKNPRKFGDYWLGCQRYQRFDCTQKFSLHDLDAAVIAAL